MSLMNSFRDEVEKMAGAKDIISTAKSYSAHGGDPSRASKFSLSQIESMKEFMARPEVRERIAARGSSTPRTALHKDIITAVARSTKASAPAPAPAVHASAASGKAKLSKLFKFVGDHKKVFGTVGGVAAAGTLAAIMAKLMRNNKSKAPVAAVEANG